MRTLRAKTITLDFESSDDVKVKSKTRKVSALLGPDRDAYCCLPAYLQTGNASSSPGTA